MIHEGPLLEYAGRDLAYLHWAAAARHWIVLVLAAEVFLPHPHATALQLASARRARPPLRRARADGDPRREDARPARAAAARGRGGGGAARDRDPARRGRVSGGLVWLLVALGLAVVVVRRRSVAVALVTAQALALTAFALYDASDSDDLVAGAALGLRALLLASLLLALVARTRETRPVRARVSLWRAAGPRSPRARTDVARARDRARVEGRGARRAGAVAFGIATAALRRATLFQILGIVLVENGLALSALELPGGASVAIELGVALDLMLVALVAAVFHERIFAEFGAGDTAALRTLRD